MIKREACEPLHGEGDGGLQTLQGIRDHLISVEGYGLLQGLIIHPAVPGLLCDARGPTALLDAASG